MVKQPKTADQQGGDGPEKARSEARQQRLEAALRENLKRRKQQTRARTDNTADLKSTTPDGVDTPATDGSDDS